MQIAMSLKWVYSQASAMKRRNVDYSLRRGICSGLTYSWLKRKLAGMSTTAEMMDDNIHESASLQRAPLGKTGHVANIVKMLQGNQTIAETQNKLLQLSYQKPIEQIEVHAKRDGMQTLEMDCEEMGFADLLDELPSGGASFIPKQYEKEIKEAGFAFSKMLMAMGGMGIFLGIQNSSGGHALGLHLSIKGAYFFDANYGEFYSPSPFMGYLWTFSNHIPHRYQLNYKKLTMIGIKGKPR
jgi:hypothetical protein